MADRPADLNDAKPSSIRHLIGQSSVVEQIVVALDSAQQDTRPFDHALLVGPPGCGKTASAQVIAAEMGGTLLDVLGQSITTIADLNAVLLQTTDRSVLFVDEAHELDKSLQTALYLALDQRKVLLQAGRRGSVPVSIPLADFTLLLATTDEYQLLQPLWDRMRLTLRFQFYRPEDLEQIVGQRSLALGWETEDGVLPQIAQRSRGTPRLALRLLQAARRVARAGGEWLVTLAHLERACQMDGVDDLGLGPTDKLKRAAKPKPNTNEYTVLLDGLGALGIAATAAQVEPIVRELFPAGINGTDPGEMIRAVFLRIRRQNSSGSVG